MKVALVGYGLAGRAFHAPLLRATPGLELAAVVSSDPAKVLADLPDVRVVPELGDALADPDVGLVVIATPDALHAAQACSALEAGRAVVVDKPFASSLAEAERVAALARARGAFLAVFHNRRWDGDFLTLKRLMAEGALGEVVQFESHFDRFRPQVRDRWRERPGAGTWKDLGPHLLDQALQLFGEPQAVSADIAAQRQGALAPDYFHVVLRHPRLRVILHSSSLASADDQRLIVHGERASFCSRGTDGQEALLRSGGAPGGAGWGRGGEPAVLTRAGPDGASVSEPVAMEAGDWRRFYAGVRDALLAGAPSPSPPEEALAVMRGLDAAERSAALRREVAFTGSSAPPG